MNNQVCFRFVVDYKSVLEYCRQTQTCTVDRIVSFPSSQFSLSLGYFDYLNKCLFFPKEITTIISEYTFKIPIEIYWHFQTDGCKFVSIKHITLKEYNDLVPNTHEYRSQTYNFKYFEVSRKYTDYVKTTI